MHRVRTKAAIFRSIWFLTALAISVGCKKHQPKSPKNSEPAKKPVSEPVKIKRWITAKGGLKLREAPNKNSRVIQIIPERAWVYVIDTVKNLILIEKKKGSWAKVEFYDQVGFVSDKYLSILEKPLYDYIDTGPPDQKKVCANISNGYDCARAIEKYQERKGSKLFLRENANLTLFLNSGKSLILKDHTTGNEVQHYFYVFLTPIRGTNFSVVSKHLWEGLSYKLINHETGESLALWSYPNFGPKQAYAISAIPCEDESYCINGIQVLDSKKSRIVFEKRFNDTRLLGLIKWLNESKALLIEMDLNNRKRYWHLEKKKARWYLY